MNKIQTIEPRVAALVNRDEIDLQIFTAKAYPRNLKLIEKTAIEMVTEDIETAMECNYRLERKDKDNNVKVITGPSIKVVEICLAEYGNCRVQSSIVSEDENTITSETVFYDLEKNAAIKETCTRNIKTKNGKRYSLDMINVTKAAALSISYRNAGRRAMPTLIRKVAEAAQKVAVGNSRTLTDRRKLMIEKFTEIGVGEKHILQKINKPKLSDITLKDIERLTGIFTSIKHGDMTVKEQFGIGNPKEATEPTVIVKKRDVGEADPPINPNQSMKENVKNAAREAGVQEDRILPAIKNNFGKELNEMNEKELSEAIDFFVGMKGV